jgi:hypothetical protein
MAVILPDRRHLRDPRDPPRRAVTADEPHVASHTSLTRREASLAAPSHLDRRACHPRRTAWLADVTAASILASIHGITTAASRSRPSTTEKHQCPTSASSAVAAR